MFKHMIWKKRKTITEKYLNSRIFIFNKGYLLLDALNFLYLRRIQTIIQTNGHLKFINN